MSETIKVRVEDTDKIVKQYDNVIHGTYKNRVSMVMGGAIPVDRDDYKDTGQKFNCDYRWFGVDGKTHDADKGDLFDVSLIDIDAKIEWWQKQKIVQQELIDKFSCKDGE